MFGDGLQSPTNLEFGIFVGCLVSLVAIVALVLTVITQVKALFFVKPIPDGQRPVTEAEFEHKLSQLESRIMAEITKPNLNYVTQAQLESKLDKLEGAINRKIDDGGMYAHQREHQFNNTLNVVRLELARITERLGMGRGRGPQDFSALEEDALTKSSK